MADDGAHAGTSRRDTIGSSSSGRGTSSQADARMHLALLQQAVQEAKRQLEISQSVDGSGSTMPQNPNHVSFGDMDSTKGPLASMQSVPTSKQQLVEYLSLLSPNTLSQAGLHSAGGVHRHEGISHKNSAPEPLSQHGYPQDGVQSHSHMLELLRQQNSISEAAGLVSRSTASAMNDNMAADALHALNALRLHSTTNENARPQQASRDDGWALNFNQDGAGMQAQSAQQQQQQLRYGRANVFQHLQHPLPTAFAVVSFMLLTWM